MATAMPGQRAITIQILRDFQITAAQQPTQCGIQIRLQDLLIPIQGRCNLPETRHLIRLQEAAVHHLWVAGVLLAAAADGLLVAVAVAEDKHFNKSFTYVFDFQCR